MRRNTHTGFFIFLIMLWLVPDLLHGQQDTFAPSAGSDPQEQWVLIIHGGAGGPPKGSMEPEREKDYIAHLDQALTVGSRILSEGGSSLDAVEAVVRYLEDCPLFNAGKGAVLNEEGQAELDASIMDGKNGKAGAVAGARIIKNPVTAARTVMEKSRHVLLAGQGADEFARVQGLEIADPDYFITPERKEAWEKWSSERKKVAPGDRAPARPSDSADRKGTVGAVALDRSGNLAAATSTGGMMGKSFGRIGDSPLIGAGTYADNQTCAVSCTGHGEFFIRNVVAYDLAARIGYSRMALGEAAREIIHEKLSSLGANGGLIAVDRDGNIAMPFNTNAMFRGFIRSDGARETAIY